MTGIEIAATEVEHARRAAEAAVAESLLHGAGVGDVRLLSGDGTTPTRSVRRG